MDDGILTGFVVIAWGALVVGTWRRVSLFPVFPVLPAVLMVIGFLLNVWIAWSGTVAVGVAHLAGVVVVRARNRRASRTADQLEGTEREP